MLLMGFQRHTCYLWGSNQVFSLFVDPISKMATMASDWHIYFQLLLKNGCSDLLQTCTDVPYGVLTKCCYFHVDPKFKMSTMAFD